MLPNSNQNQKQNSIPFIALASGLGSVPKLQTWGTNHELYKYSDNEQEEPFCKQVSG
jgi:hypothetical protein